MMDDNAMYARLAVLVLIAISLTSVALWYARAPQQSPYDTGNKAVMEVDPLQAELKRCQRLGQRAGTDASCMDVWAENRNRFLKSSGNGERP